jgi:hypothetical protein
MKKPDFAVGGYWHCDKCGEEYHSGSLHTCDPSFTARPDEPKGDKLYGQVITDTLEGRALSMAVRPVATKGDVADLLVEFATKELQAERERREDADRIVDAVRLVYSEWQIKSLQLVKLAEGNPESVENGVADFLVGEGG